MLRTLFIAALCGFGCAGDPEDPFFLYGRVQDATARSLSRAPITLSRGEGEICSYRLFREALWPRFFEQPDFEPFRQTETDEDGRFLFQLLRYELTPSPYHPFNPTTFCYRVDVEAGQDGAHTSVWTGMYNRDVFLERVFRWDEGVISLEPTAGGHLLSAPPGPLPRSDTIEPFSRDIVAYEWELTAAGKPLWRSEQTASPFLVDGPVREDFAEVKAHAIMLSFLVSHDVARAAPELEDFFGSGGVYVEHATGSTVVLPGIASRVPVSRGASCSIGGTRLDPCAATDGKLDLVKFTFPDAKTPEEAVNNALVVELSAPARPSLAILRGVPTPPIDGSITLEGSADGLTWFPLASLQFPRPFSPDMSRVGPYEWQTMTMGAGRFVRVDLAPTAEPVTRIRAPGVSALRELSIFE
jgi:hypothetical protein